MRLSAKMIATAASVVLQVSAFSLWASSEDRPLVNNDMALAAEPVALRPAHPMPRFAMATATPYTRGRNMGTPTAELFLGYSYLRAVPTMADGNRLVWMNGGSTSLAFNINRYLGVVGDFGAYTNSKIRFTGGSTSTIDVDNSNIAAMSYLFGPRVSFRGHRRLTPFVQALFGGIHANQVSLANCTLGCTLLPNQNSFAMTAGGGLDYRVSRHFAIRVVQAEYLMTRFTDFTSGDTGTQNDMRLSAGVVFRFGGNTARPLPPASPLEYSCSVNPTSVYAGDRIAASGTAVNLNPAKEAIYTWAGDGGTLTALSSTARIDTAGTAAGSYTLRGHVSQGDKASENADCTAPYAVRVYEPPTVSCSASPATVLSGTPSTITAVGISPQNRPLVYSYRSDFGAMSGSGSTVMLATLGAVPGPIAVTCSVTDDKGQSASSTTLVTIAAPIAAPKPQVSSLCSIHFDRDVKRPVRVDNEAKGCLDDVALTLQRSVNARLAVVGEASSKEKDAKRLAAERAINTKDYLVDEKGIDPARISIYTGTLDEKSVSNTLVPAGATLNTAGYSTIE